jgi:hypothetical protein
VRLESFHAKDFGTASPAPERDLLFVARLPADGCRSREVFACFRFRSLCGHDRRIAENLRKVDWIVPAPASGLAYHQQLW